MNPHFSIYSFDALRFFLHMHGSHFLNEEYQISASRLSTSKKNSCENLNPNRSDEAVESLAHKQEKNRLWQELKTFCKIIAFLSLLIGSFAPTKFLNLAVIVSHATPKFLMFKRSFVTGRTDVSTASPSDSRIIEITPAPLHLIIALSSLDEAKRIMKTDAAAQLITPNRNISSADYNFTANGKIHLDINSTSIFESLAFSWCEAFRKNMIYPTKLIVTGPAKISKCVMGRYRWALKFPKELISFREVNGTTEIYPNFSDCSKHRQDLFDCNTKDREEIRFKYSQMCPDMEPILMACSNRFALEKALAYKPKWNNKKK